METLSPRNSVSAMDQVPLLRFRVNRPLRVATWRVLDMGLLLTAGQRLQNEYLSVFGHRI